MADYQLKKDASGNFDYIDYVKEAQARGEMGTDGGVTAAMKAFRDGDITDPLNPLPKVDMSLFDQATMCATCHVGGIFYEQDRTGKRLPARMFQDWGAAMVGMGLPNINTATSTVWEAYDQMGAQTSFTTYAPWAYPLFAGFDGVHGAPVIAPNGWAPAGTAQNMSSRGGIQMADPNNGFMYQLAPKQLMIPNVKEMDCLFCHLKGYDNVMASVMTQAGNLAMAPSAGAGFMDMMPTSPTFMGYAAQAVTIGAPIPGMGAPVSIPGGTLAKILAKPDSDNCMQCHATRTLRNLPEMFGISGTGNGFLSSAPMVFDPDHGSMGPLGKRMTSYDINAMWMFTGNSPAITSSNFMDYLMPGMNYTQAEDTSFKTSFNPDGTSTGKLSNGNPAGTGPLYYDGDLAKYGAEVFKKSGMPFPRAEWFKRGDAWQTGKDVHSSFGCAGCHFTGDATHKNQCDPGRGFDMASTVQDGVPPIYKGAVADHYDDVTGAPVLSTDLKASIQKHDTRNTVKRCEFCHITGKDYYGQQIDNFGAPNPDHAHAASGLTSNMVQIVDKMDPHGPFGGQGVSKDTDFSKPNNKLDKGTHLDVMDCTVCHVQKISMAVRALDATSGMRFPAIVGTQPEKGMVGLFEDPGTDAFNAGVVTQYNQMYAGINGFFGYSSAGNKFGAAPAVGSPAAGMGIPYGPGYQTLLAADAHPMGGKLQEWKPLHLWQKLGNMEAPLTTDYTGSNNSANSGMQFRRKIYLSNAISAVLWNNTDPTVDANGDGAKGGLLNNAKPELVGYHEIFDTTENLDKNNTQGFDEPIYDPWIMRDLKAGFNFYGSALSVISVGFGNGPYASAYDANGFFTGAWKYASVWSGATIFTEPAEITAYKASRGPSWSKTQMAYVGAPFMITHGIQPITNYVLGSAKYGKGCADCHAQGAGFFNGGFDMVGTAVPADKTYNPTSSVCMPGTGNQSDPAHPVPCVLNVDPNTGDVTRSPGLPGFTSTDPATDRIHATNFMARPLEPVRVKAVAGDLHTALEGFNKLGQPRSATFEITKGGFTWTTDLKRADALYPPEFEAGVEQKIYSPITKMNLAPNAAGTMTGQQFADYLENTAAVYAAAQAALGYNVTVDPTDIAWQLPTKPAPPANLNLAPSAIITFDGTTWDGSSPTVDETYTKVIADANGILTNTQIGPFTRKAYNPAHLANAITGQPVSIVATDMSIPAVGAPTPMAAVPATYSWMVNTGKAYIQDPESRDTLITFQKPGVYQLTLTVKRSGKVAKLTQRVNVIAPQIMSIAGIDLSVTNPVLTVPDVVITETTDAYSTALHPIYIDSIATSPSLVITPTTLCDKIKVIWGDKTTSTIVNAGMPGSPITIAPHAYDVLAGVQEPLTNAFTAWDSNALSANGLGAAYRQNFQFQVGPAVAGKIPYQFHTTIQLLRGTQVVGNRTILVKTNAAMPAHITLLP